ncbi:MAG: prepilin-type N-terminal cleavage/methylation domain-containing protein [Verrucomicrobia bacterium]|nr:prepilin-type N-terminal cleavage/methylation domain-containing protein [Verrucomicrobiota bacterium]
MNVAPCIHPAVASRRGIHAFTLPEMMVVMAIFTLVVIAFIGAHITGQRFYSISEAKLVAADQVRQSFADLVVDVRSAKLVQVGTGTASSFTQVTNGGSQSGVAIQIFPSTNTNYYVRYFLDTSAQQLKRITNGNAATAKIIASSVTNTVPFTAEDYAGNVLTGNKNNRVIGVLLQLNKIEFPEVRVGGTNNYYDQFQLRSKITRRTLE